MTDDRSFSFYHQMSCLDLAMAFFRKLLLLNRNSSGKLSSSSFHCHKLYTGSSFIKHWCVYNGIHDGMSRHRSSAFCCHVLILGLTWSMEKCCFYSPTLLGQLSQGEKMKALAFDHFFHAHLLQSLFFLVDTYRYSPVMSYPTGCPEQICTQLIFCMVIFMAGALAFLFYIIHISN